MGLRSMSIVSAVVVALGVAAPGFAAVQTIVNISGTDATSQIERLGGIPDLQPSPGTTSIPTGSPTTIAQFGNISQPLNLTTPMTPTPEGWTTIPGETNTVYGGYESTGPGNRVFGAAYYRPSSLGYRFEFRGPDSVGVDPIYGVFNGEANRLGVLMFVKKADFLDGGDASPVSIDSSSVITVNGGPNNNGRDVVLRLVIQQGGQFYIGTAAGFGRSGVFSADNFSVSTAGVTANNVTFGDLAFETYDPTTAVGFPDSSVGTGTPYAGPFDNIEGIGIYMEAGRDLGQSERLRVGIESFVVTVVPEPASMALLGLGGIALIVRRRR